MEASVYDFVAQEHKLRSSVDFAVFVVGSLCASKVK